MNTSANGPLSANLEPSADADLDIPTLTEPGHRQEPALKSPATNPFAAASEDFFPGGQRKRLFDQLRHLSQWSRRALLVTGTLGSGKTTLHGHLSRALSKDASAAALQGSEVSNQHELFVQLTAQLGIDHAGDAATGLLSDLLRGYVQTQNDLEQLCVILVDDAQELDGGAMEALLSLSADCRVRLIFFGEASLTKLVDKATVNLEIACHETPLLALSAADSRAYIEWRTKQLGYTQLPFDEEQLAVLYTSSDGVPGRIDVLASQMLEEMALTGGVAPQSRSALEPMKRFPRSNLLIALALAGVLGAIYYLLDSAASDEPAVVDAGAIATDRAADTASIAVQEPLPQQQLTDEALAQEQLVRDQLAQTEMAVLQAQAEREQAQLLADEAKAELAEANAAKLAQEELAQEELAQEQIAREQAARDVAAQERAAQQLAEQQQRAAEQSAAATPAPAPAGTSSAALAALVPGVRDGQWLLEQDGGHYTVQLVTLGSRDGMIKYLGSHAQPERFALYARSSDNQTLYVATFGSYATRGQAEAASESLPASVGKIKPWIRPFREVQQTIRASR